MEYFVRHFGTDHKVLCRYGDWCSLEGKGVVHVSEIEGVLPCDGYNSSVQLPHFLAAPTPKPEQKLTNPKDAVGTKKVSFSVLPWRVLVNVALAMMEGALKYGRHNYRAAGVRASVYFDAVVGRHLTDWWEGTDIDPDSGLHHIDKAIAGLMVMRDSMLQGNFEDDRPPRGGVDIAEANKRAAELIDRYGHVKPQHYTIKD
jgi:hypothetical protein